ncbi:MAG: hypothetical protein KAW45_04600 [Thermoplasmatales archaeon]|nr:hypothetical protein [Thermoplasmatales archaeon]
MKKFIPILIVGVLLISGLGAVAAPKENVESERLNVIFSQPMVVSEEDFVTVTIDEANSFLMEQGKPLLPSYVHTFTYPFGTKIKSVTVTPTNIQTQTVSKELMPTPERAIVGSNVVSAQKTVSYGTEVYPSKWFDYDVSGGRHNGELSVIVDVEVYPINYHPVSNIIEYAKEVDIAIEYEPSTEPQPTRADYDLIVIGPNEFSDELAPLITHKNGRGVTAKFVGLTEVYGGTGRDNQEKIKYYIKDAIETWSTGNVLLVGSSLKFPTRTVHIWIQEEYDIYGYVEIFVSDLYYADIYDEYGAFCSWDSNGNDVFGEYEWEGNTDEMDLLPDVYLGRWACTSGSQVTTMVNKVITYENTPAYQQAWFNTLVVVGGDTSPDYECIEGEYINQKVIDMMDGFIPNKQWVTNGKLTQPLMGVTNIKNAINAGCGFVDFSGHGNTNIWATHPEESHQWVPTPYPPGYISSNHIGQLNNGDELPIVAVEACSTAKFNTDTNTFNWAFLANANGGGIGAFGATGLGWGYVGTGIAQGLIGKMGLDTFRGYALDDAVTYGEMWEKALDRFITPSMDEMEIKTTCEWEPFGDPSLVIGEESNPPATPDAPDGPPSGGINTEYTYTASTTDPDGDKIEYMFDWDDGTTSGWVGPYNSGQTGSAKKTWTVQGTYLVKVVAKDEHGKLSDWSDPLAVSMPKNKAFFFNSILLEILERLMERFPLLEQILSSRPIISELLGL